MFYSDRLVKAAAGAVAGSLLLGGGLLFAMDPDPASPAAAGTSRSAGAKAEGNSVSAFGLGGEAVVVPGLGLDGPANLGVNATNKGSSVSSGATGTASGPGKAQGAAATAGANGAKGASGTVGAGGAGGNVGTGGGSTGGGAQFKPPAGPNAPAAPKAPNVAVPQSVSREGSFTVVVPAVAGQAYRLCVSGNVDEDGAARCQVVDIPGAKGVTLTLTYSGNASAQAPKFTPGTCSGGSTVTVAGLTPGAKVKATVKSSSAPDKTVSAGVAGKNSSVTASLCKA